MCVCVYAEVSSLWNLFIQKVDDFPLTDEGSPGGTLRTFFVCRGSAERWKHIYSFEGTHKKKQWTWSKQAITYQLHLLCGIALYLTGNRLFYLKLSIWNKDILHSGNKIASSANRLTSRNIFTMLFTLLVGWGLSFQNQKRKRYYLSWVLFPDNHGKIGIPVVTLQKKANAAEAISTW